MTKLPTRVPTKYAGRDPETGAKIPHKMSEATAVEIHKLALRGATVKEIAVILDLRPGQVKLYEKLINQQLAIHNLDVTEALRRVAVGAQTPDTWIGAHMDPKTGRVTVTKVPLTKHYPPNVAAITFFLKNRKPEEFKEQPTGVLDIDATADAVKQRLATILRTTEGKGLATSKPKEGAE